MEPGWHHSPANGNHSREKLPGSGSRRAPRHARLMATGMLIDSCPRAQLPP
jgi:hypothetical protein